jgi:hypothetical protein
LAFHDHGCSTVLIRQPVKWSTRFRVLKTDPCEVQDFLKLSQISDVRLITPGIERLIWIALGHFGFEYAVQKGGLPDRKHCEELGGNRSFVLEALCTRGRLVSFNQARTRTTVLKECASPN